MNISAVAIKLIYKLPPIHLEASFVEPRLVQVLFIEASKHLQCRGGSLALCPAENTVQGGRKPRTFLITVNSYLTNGLTV